MNRFRIDLAYDGTSFEGWQSQVEGSRTIQTTIEKALATLVKAPVALVGAGRTDSGVHARSQTAHFEVEKSTMTRLAFQRGLNSLLPQTIRIINCQLVDQSFHSRFSALARVYHYYLVVGENPLPWELPWALKVTKTPSLDHLNAMARQLHGELDFTTFSHTRDPSASRERFIHQATWFPTKDRIVFRITGNAFLWRMVRSLVGSMLEFSKVVDGPKLFQKALMGKDRSLAGPTAPAHGLFLHKVVYDVSDFAF